MTLRAQLQPGLHHRADRRRFLAISAAAAGLAIVGAGPSRAAGGLTQWRGTALGAGASITLAHPDAAAIIARARAEIARLEAIFSLFRSDSELVRLNATGLLRAPSPELLGCLALCSTVHAASGGVFDPTIQPLWRLYAESHAAGAAPDAEALQRRRALVGWQHVTFDASAVHLARPGMALTLNGVAQGVIADRVAALLRDEGLHDVLIDTGEICALGAAPGQGNWSVALDVEAQEAAPSVALRDTALASSSPRGTVFDAAGAVGHIIDPRSGLAAMTEWRLISVTAPQAGLADALSTAMCLMTRDEIAGLLANFPAARLVWLS